MGGDGEFILSLTLFKMMEAMKIKDIDTMIKSLENELQGVTITPTPQPSQEATPKLEAVPTHESPKQESTPQESTPIQEVAQKEQPKEALPSQEPTPTPPPKPTLDQGALLFKKLIEKIYDRNYGLGEIFEKNISYASFENGILTWDSSATNGDKKVLISQWSLIKTFVQEIFGIETTIKSNTKPQVEQKKNEPPQQPIEHSPTPPPQCAPDEEAGGSMIEDIEMKSSCLSPEHNSSNEIEPSQILNEPMIKETIKLFEPSKVRVRKKV